MLYCIDCNKMLLLLLFLVAVSGQQVVLHNGICSQPCGGGLQTVSYGCIASGNATAIEACLGDNVLGPPSSKACNVFACPDLVQQNVTQLYDVVTNVTQLQPVYHNLTVLYYTVDLNYTVLIPYDQNLTWIQYNYVDVNVTEVVPIDVNSTEVLLQYVYANVVYQIRPPNASNVNIRLDVVNNTAILTIYSTVLFYQNITVINYTAILQNVTVDVVNTVVNYTHHTTYVTLYQNVTNTITDRIENKIYSFYTPNITVSVGPDEGLNPLSISFFSLVGACGIAYLLIMATKQASALPEQGFDALSTINPDVAPPQTAGKSVTWGRMQRTMRGNNVRIKKVPIRKQN